MTLVVNSPFQAELSTGADLSHAQLGWGQGGSWHCTLESLLPGGISGMQAAPPPTTPLPQVGGLWGLSVLVHPASWLLLATSSPSELIARWAGFGR